MTLTATIVGLAIAMERSSYDMWAAVWIAPALLLCTVPIATRVARAEGDPQLARFIFGAAILKIVGGSVLRWAMVYLAYGTGDADRYHTAALGLRPLFLDGQFGDLGKIESTRAVEIFTGLVYTAVGPTRIGGFMVYSWLAFVGLVCFYRAARVSFPNTNLRRYRLLIFLLPTNWFWPSSIGKDALMVLALGVATLGTAYLLAGRGRGLLLFAAGAWGAAIIRPHLTLILVIALGAGSVIRLFNRRLGTGEIVRFGRRAFLVALIPLCLALLVPVVVSRFGLSTLDPDSARTFGTEVERRTGQGGSEYRPAASSSPLGYVQGALAVLFRPLPNEARDLGTALSSAESAFILILILKQRRDVLANLRRTSTEPFLAMALAYVAVFCYAFASVLNLGILGRQRVQVLPFLLLFLIRREPQNNSRSPRSSLRSRRDGTPGRARGRQVTTGPTRGSGRNPLELGKPTPTA